MAREFVIYLPVRNGSRHVDIAVASVMAQTHGAWRLVVLENASTDDTPARLARYDDPRITVLPADRSLSIHANWHRAHELMASEPEDRLVTFLGHDDVYHPKFLADIAELASEHPEASCYQTLFDLIDENDGRMRPCRPVPDRESWTALLDNLLWSQRDSFGTGYVFRAGDYRRVGGIPNLPMLLFSDWLVFTRLTRLSYKASTLSNRFSYRRHIGSTSGAPSREKYAAHLAGMAKFVRIVQGEFAPFAQTDAGRAGLAAFLARELSLLNVPVIRADFSRKDRGKLDALLALYEQVAGGVPASTLVGQPYRPARLFMALRRFNAAQAYLRQRLRSRFRRR